MDQSLDVLVDAAKKETGGRSRGGGRGGRKPRRGALAGRLDSRSGSGPYDRSGGRRGRGGGRGGRGGRSGGGGGGGGGGGAGGSAAAGAGGARGMTVAELASAPAADRVLKASSESRPQSIAGSIAYMSRLGECPSLRAIGASSINQALKALIIGRDYLEADNIDYSIQAEDQPETGRDAVLFRLFKSDRRPTAAVSPTQLKVASSSDPGTVAGAVAGKIRDGERVAMIGIGAEAVKRIVKAAIAARRYLSDDGLDIRIRPEFVEVDMGGGRKSAIQVHILALQI